MSEIDSTSASKGVVMITGGAGFIGSQLGYNLEKQGWNVILLDDMSYGTNENLIINGERFGTFIKCDIRSKEIFKYMEGVDIVIHCAGIAPLPDCQIDPYRCMDVNVGGLANTLEAARRANVKRIIFASTSAVYENGTTFPSKETDVLCPTLIYPCSKQQGEILCKSFIHNYNMEIVILRFFNIFGPHQDLFRKHPPFMGYAIRELMNERIPTFYNDGTQKRDYIFVDDLVDIINICMVHNDAPGGTFNVASGKSYSVNELYSEISKHFPVKLTPNYAKPGNFWDRYPELFQGTMPLNRSIVEKEVTKYSEGSCDNAKAILGWEPKISIEEAIEKTVSYFLLNNHNSNDNDNNDNNI